MKTGEADEQELAQVARGDGVAFARLVRAHQRRLTAMAARIIGDRRLAEEVVQDTFTRCWVKAPQLNAARAGGASLAGWLSRVAVNLAIDQVRRPRMSPLEQAPEPADPALGPEAALLNRERDRRLDAALAGLAPRQRAAIALAYDAGLSNAAAAAAMQVSVGAYELLLVRARRALRLAMTEEEDA